MLFHVTISKHNPYSQRSYCIISVLHMTNNNNNIITYIVEYNLLRQ